MKSAPLTLLMLLVFAGCASPVQLESVTVAGTLTHAFTGYTWPAPIVHDGNGTILADARLPAGPGGLPRYVEQLLPGAGAEPNIGITKKGNLFVSTFDQVQRSSDHGKTWTVVHDFTSPGYPTSVDYWGTADPMLWVDPDTDRVFSQHMHPALLCNYIAHSDQEGAPGSWTERPFTCGVPLIDHEKLMTARYHATALPEPPRAYQNVLYVCVNKFPNFPVVFEASMGTWCSVSFDSGATFAYDRQVLPPTENCPAINGHPAAWPDGTVVVPIGLGFGADCHRPVTVVTSEDNGLTWTPHELPKDIQEVEIDPDITITPDGTAYLLFRALDQKVYLARSKDRFATWDGPWRVSPPDHTMGAFTAITSGDDGRVAMAYLGTRTPQDRDATESTAASGTVWHLYVTTSLDAAAAQPTFVTRQVTPEQDPVQIGCVWLGGGGGGNRACRNLLDFIDMAHDADGRAYVAFTDGCTPRNGCAGDTDAVAEQSRDSQVAVAALDAGWSLFAAKGILPSLGLEHPAPYPLTAQDSASPSPSASPSRRTNP